MGTIQINSPDPNGISSYIGWSVIKCQVGEDDEVERMCKNGTKARPFNFSGTMGTLPDFHKAINTLLTYAKDPKYATAEEALQRVNLEGIADISDNGTAIYPRDVMEFKDYRVYTDTARYMSADNQQHAYEALTLTKKKSKQAMQKTKAGQSALHFFVMQLPVRTLPNLCLALEMMMNLNEIPTLPCASLEHPKYPDTPFAAAESSASTSDREETTKKRKKKKEEAEEDKDYTPGSDEDGSSSSSSASTSDTVIIDEEDEEPKKKKKKRGRKAKRSPAHKRRRHDMSSSSNSDTEEEEKEEKEKKKRRRKKKKQKTKETVSSSEESEEEEEKEEEKKKKKKK